MTDSSLPPLPPRPYGLDPEPEVCPARRSLVGLVAFWGLRALVCVCFTLAGAQWGRRVETIRERAIVHFEPVPYLCQSCERPGIWHRCPWISTDAFVAGEDLVRVREAIARRLESPIP